MADTVEVQPHEAEQIPEEQPERRPGGGAPKQNDQPQPPKREERKPEERKPRKSWGRRIREHPIGFLAFIILLVALGIGIYFLMQYFSSYEDTDDAQIDGNIYAITSRIAGTITAVHV